MTAHRLVGDLSADGTHVWAGRRWEPLWLRPPEVSAAAELCFGRLVGSPTFMAEGMLNQSWRVESADGGYVLRVSRPELSRERVSYEHVVLTQLHDEVREAVTPLPGTDGETIQIWNGRTLSLFPYIEGILGADVEPSIRCERSATTLALIHRAGSRLDVAQSPELHAVDQQPTMWAAVRPILARDLPPTDEVSELFGFFDRETADLETWLDGTRSGRRLLRGIIHGDFNPRNLIFDRNQLVAVIDWENCQLNALAFEVAGVAFGTPDPLAFWYRYLDAGGPLTDDDIELLSWFARIGRLIELCFTVDGEQAKPWAIENLRGVANDVMRLNQWIAELGL